MVRLLPLLLLWLLRSAVTSQNRSCTQSKCVKRESVFIKAILHGVPSHPFWQRVHAAMRQTAADMRVELDIESVTDPLRMANDISQVLQSRRLPDALIVSIPATIVQQAVGEVVADGRVPVFGLNAGTEVAEALGVLGFVSMNDVLGGNRAGEFHAEELQRRGLTLAGRGLYVNHELGRASFEQRLIGLEQALPNMTMDRLEWFSSIGDDDKRAQAFQKLIGCPYDVIQLAGAPPLALILESMQLNGCDFRSTVVGAFDTDDVVYEALSSDRLAFTITQQPHLQGAFVVMMSVLYATTGQKLASPIESKDGVYLAGPLLLTKDNVLSHTQQTCEEEGYPICPNKLALDGSVAQCACTNRRNIVLAGVTHGLTTDGFWDAVYAGMDQAALDYDVQLLAVRMDPKNDTDTLLVEMVQQIREVCRQNIDGLFVSIPNTVVEDVIEECQTLGVPIVSINTGAEASERLGLLEHIGQLEWRAGMSAGERLIEAGARRGVCLIDESFNAGQVDRCLGMEQAFQDSEEQVEFMGSHVVPYNNPGEYQNIVEGILGKEGSWDDIAILPTGLRQLDSVLALQADHYGLITGVFDLNERVYDLLDNGKVRFAIDQNAYLQGYLPVPLLAFKAYTGQSLVNKFVESGPDFVLSSPSKEKVACQEILFQACPMDADGPLVVDENARLSPGAIGGIIVCVMLATAFVVYAAIRLHQLSARLDKRKEKGEDVPRLSLRRRLRVLVKPVDTVVLSTRRRCSPTEFLAKEPSHDSPSPDVAVIDCSTATTREAGDMEEAMDDDISDLPRTRYMIKGNSSLNCAFYDNEVSEDET